jgi:hypothetical protein
MTHPASHQAASASPASTASASPASTASAIAASTISARRISLTSSTVFSPSLRRRVPCKVRVGGLFTPHRVNDGTGRVADVRISIGAIRNVVVE